MKLNPSLQLDDLKKGLSLRIQRDFVTALGRPLSPDDKIPEQQDLALFWVKCERAIEGLSTAFSTADLTEEHIDPLAPLMLGITAWEVVRGSVFMNWA